MHNNKVNNSSAENNKTTNNGLGNSNRGNKNRKRKKNRSNVYGVVDLGTNNCRLLIAIAKGNGFKVIDSFSRIVRLGEGFQKQKSISEAYYAHGKNEPSRCYPDVECCYSSMS